MKTLNDLVSSMKVKGYLQSPEIEAAFRGIDRKDFVPGSLKWYCYEDRPLPIGWGQTISQPSTVAFMLELLKPAAGQEILDIGCGSGYATALLAYIAAKEGKVWAVERVKELSELAEKNLAAYPQYNYSVIHSDRVLGLPGRKFDRILVSAAAEEMPEALLEQLKAPGRLVIPVKNSIILCQKTFQGEIFTQKHFGFSFVPLIMGNRENL